MDVKLHDALMIGGVIGLAAFLLWWNAKGTAGVTRSLVGGGIGMVDGVFTGTVKGIGDAVGVPDTNLTQCQKDLAAGDKWAASFSCPAGTFLKHVFD